MLLVLESLIAILVGLSHLCHRSFNVNTIEKRIKNIQEEIQNIKTRQETQADSYLFYKYVSDNLYPSVSEGHHIIKARFIPYGNATEGILCKFFSMCNNLLFWQAQDMLNPLEYYLSATFSTSPGIPNDVYISCVTSMPGQLEITIVK